MYSHPGAAQSTDPANVVRSVWQGHCAFVIVVVGKHVVALDERARTTIYLEGKEDHAARTSFVTSQQGTPPYNDVFIDTLVRRLAPPLTQQVATVRTKLVGMSLALAMISLVALFVLTYLFLSMGAAGIHAAGVQLGAGLSAAQQILGISITSLAIVLINGVFSIVVFREKP